MTGVAAMLVRWRRTMVPFLGWIGELKDPQILKADLNAGITVALVLVPQSMDYARLAGWSPYVGLYASFIPVLLAAIMGSSRQPGTGPVTVVDCRSPATTGRNRRRRLSSLRGDVGNPGWRISVGTGVITTWCVGGFPVSPGRRGFHQGCGDHYRDLAAIQIVRCGGRVRSASWCCRCG